MAKLPSKYDLSGPVGMRSGRVIASADQSAIGRGLASFGQSLAAIGEDRKRSNLALEATQADGGATGALYDLERSFENETDYQNFGQRFEAETQKIKATQGAKITDPLKRKLWEAEFDKQKQAARDRVLTLGQNREKENFAVLARDSLMEYQRVFADPDVPAEERNRAKASADASIRVLQQEGVLSPEKASEWRKAVIEGGEFIFATREIERDPSVITGARAASGDVVDRIIGVESGGNANAKNPRSSAEGAGQFIDSTWLNMIRTYRPDIAAGKSAAEIIALKRDGKLSREMVEAYKNENAQYLTNRGQQVTDGNLYLAHFAGAGGAVQVLTADPNASVASVLGRDKVRANPFLAKMTAGDLIAWADKKMGAPARQLPDWYTNADADTQLKYEEMAAARERQLQIEADANLKAQQEARNDDYRLRIANGDTTLSALDINTDPYLDDGKKATLINELNSKRGDEISTAAAMQSFREGSLMVDPYDTEGRKLVDNVFNEAIKSVPEEQVQPLAEELVRQTGVVPRAAFSAIRQGLESTSITEVAAAAQSAQRIASINSAAFGRRDGGAAIQSAADDFTHYVTDLNLTPEQAAQRMIDARDPAKQRERKALEPAAKEFMKELDTYDLAGAFNDTWFSGDPALGFNAQQMYGITAEFKAIAEDQFFKSNGDPEIAKARALAEMKRLYGVTDLTGNRTVMRHPPERFWPKSILGVETGVTISGGGGQGPGNVMSTGPAEPSLDYAWAQLQADIRTLNPDADTTSVQLVTTPETDAMVKRGELPGYAVLYKDRNGVLQTLPGKLWRPDVTKAEEVQKQQDAADQAEREKRARWQQEDMRDKAERMQSEDGGRGEVLDRFLYGDPLTGQMPVDRNTTTEALPSGKGDRVAPTEPSPERFGY